MTACPFWSSRVKSGACSPGFTRLRSVAGNPAPSVGPSGASAARTRGPCAGGRRSKSASSSAQPTARSADACRTARDRRRAAGTNSTSDRVIRGRENRRSPFGLNQANDERRDTSDDHLVTVRCDWRRCRRWPSRGGAARFCGAAAHRGAPAGDSRSIVNTTRNCASFLPRLSGGE